MRNVTILLLSILFVGCVFAEDELTDRRVISINYSINENNNMSLKDAKSYQWFNDLKRGTLIVI